MKKLRIHYLQHVPFEGLGAIADWISQNNHCLTGSRMYEQDEFPDTSTFDWLFIMGGPMSVYEEKKYPWLKAEKLFIQKAIAEGKTLTGICLGSQLIAAALGAAVYPAKEKEIGWFPVQPTASASTTLFNRLLDAFPVCHWHGDTFDLPSGAVRLAESAVCKNQAFLYKERVLGLQFHFELNRSSLKQLIANCKHELQAGTYIQQEKQLWEGFEKHGESNQKALFQILNYLAENA